LPNCNTPPLIDCACTCWALSLAGSGNKLSRVDTHVHLRNLHRLVEPSPEAEEYQVQLREKVQRERRTGKGNRDTTRYDVSVSGNMHPNLSKRDAVLRVVQSLVALGHAPEEISAAVGERFFERRFRGGAQGHLTESEFVEAMSLIRRGKGKTFDPRRWYTQDDELICHDGQTYAFSNQWGGQKWLTAMKALTRGFPSADIRFDPTGSAD